MRLLPMEYKPSELADELGVSKETVYRSFLPDCPHRKDKEGSIWINGKDFSGWVITALMARKDGTQIDNDHVYCVHCKTIVPFTANIKRMSKRGGLIGYGACPVCAGKVVRYLKNA